MNANPLPLSGVIITRNEADRIERCVRSLTAVCQEVIVLDSGSVDDTLMRASAAGAFIGYQDWLGFSAQKNAAIDLATQPWVLLLDADEWLAEGAHKELRRLFADEDVEQADVWCLRRRTHFLGRALRHGGWGSERVQRLFRRDLRYRPDKVHERLDTRDRRVRTVGIGIEHDTARSESEYQQKLANYARLWAEQKQIEGRSAGLVAAASHAIGYWTKNFVLRGGFLDGRAGWRFHRCHTGYVLAKYLILAGFVS